MVNDGIDSSDIYVDEFKVIKLIIVIVLISMLVVLNK